MSDRPNPGEMKPFEWMVWAALDLGSEALAEACKWLIADRQAALDNAGWQASRRLEVQAELERVKNEKESPPLTTPNNQV